LIRLENRVDRGQVVAADQQELDVDGVKLALCDVRVLGDTDPNTYLAPVGQLRGRFDGLTSQAHAPSILAERDN